MSALFRRPNIAIGITIGIGLMVSFLLYLTRIPSISAAGALLSLTVIWAGLVPSLVYLSRPQPRPMPVMPLCGFFYVVAFGLPTFLIPLAWPEGVPIRTLAERRAGGRARGAARGISARGGGYHSACCRVLVLSALAVFESTLRQDWK